MAGNDEPQTVHTWIDAIDEEEGAPARVNLPPERFEVVEEIGRGGMARVVSARDNTLRRVVAVKELEPQGVLTRDHLRRFLGEAQITAQLEHPGIVPVYDLDAGTGGALSYSMMLIEGQSLAETMQRSSQERREGRASPGYRRSDLLDHWLKVCEAVDYAHDRGVVHRDLKPDNIMVGGHGEVYVVDWGMAKLLEDDDARSSVEQSEAARTSDREGAVRGTPTYMAPEQALGHESLIGPAADQYALGLVLAEIVNGKPFRTRDVGASLGEARRGIQPRLIACHPSEPVDEALRAIVHHATAADPADRYPNLAAFAEDVRRWRLGEPVRVHPESLGERAQRWVRGHSHLVLPGVLSAALVATVIIASLMAFTFVQRQRAVAREQALADYVAAVSRRSRALDTHLASIEAQVEALAASAEELLRHGQPVDDPIFLAPTFNDHAPDVVDSPQYGKPISRTWADVGLFPGVELAHVEHEVRQLIPIRHRMRRAHLLLRDGDAEAWRTEQGPINWTMLALESGLLFSMPGTQWEEDGYDSRPRPWYVDARQAQEAHWGSPVRGAISGVLQVTCSAPVRDEDGGLLGVAAVQTAFAYLIDNYLAMHDIPGVRETFLLDRDGHIVVRSHERETDQQEALSEQYEATPYRFPTVLESVVANDAGVVRVQEDGRRLLLVHQRLSSADWSVVVEADEAAALGATP